ncbi:MAG: tetratricopeptide repeat protein [Bacteroidales bacterium]
MFVRIFPRLPLVPFLLLILGCLTLGCRSGEDSENKRGAAPADPNAGFVGRESCRECHLKQFDLYRDSDHDMAMDTALASTVLGDFEDARFTHLGITTRFYRSGDRYMVHTEGPDGTMQDFQVAYVFGIRPLQQYLIPFPGGRLQCLPLAWDTRPAEQGGQRWFHLYPDERIAHDDILYWTRINQNWNYMCAECHSTNLRKDYDHSSKEYHTTWSEIDVSCEACHGPGAAHLDWARNVEAGSPPDHMPDMGLVIRLKDTDNASWVFDPDSATARRSVPRTSDQLVQMCGRCHSRRAVMTEDYEYGKSLLDSHWPSLLEEGLYFSDGQILEEVYVYGSFLQSKMYQAGVVCKDCHEPHSGQVYSQGNALCYRCHLASEYGTRDHHFHNPAKEGALCTECHMHERTYMVVDPRRDHSIRIPRPDLSDELQSPNACIQCHEDKDNDWATRYMLQWYGRDFANRDQYGETFWAGRRQYPDALDGLVRLMKDKEQAPMIRATAVSLLGSYPDDRSLEALQSVAADSDPLVRFAVLNAIQLADPELVRAIALPRLSDTTRLVRLMAANCLSSVPAAMIPEGSRERLQKALEEYNASLMINADHPSTHLTFGNLFLNAGKTDRAEASYLEAIELEPGLVAPYINLADLYRQMGRDGEGAALLENALARYPDMAALHFAMGLLDVRQGRTEKAMSHLETAARLEPGDAHYSYVYGIALHSGGRSEDALRSLEEALLRHPFDRNILYGLCTISLEQGNLDRARELAAKLVAYDPKNEEYRQLLRTLEAMEG